VILFGAYSDDYTAGMIDGLLAEHAGHDFKMFEDPEKIEGELWHDDWLRKKRLAKGSQPC